MRVGIATDHGGFGLKEDLVAHLRQTGYDVIDFGARYLVPNDDYPDFVVPLAQAVQGETWTAEWQSAAAAWERQSAPLRFLAYTRG